MLMVYYKKKYKNPIKYKNYFINQYSYIFIYFLNKFKNNFINFRWCFNNNLNFYIFQSSLNKIYKNNNNNAFYKNNKIFKKISIFFIKKKYNFYLFSFKKKKYRNKVKNKNNFYFKFLINKFFFLNYNINKFKKILLFKKYSFIKNRYKFYKSNDLYNKFIFFNTIFKKIKFFYKIKTSIRLIKKNYIKSNKLKKYLNLKKKLNLSFYKKIFKFKKKIINYNNYIKINNTKNLNILKVKMSYKNSKKLLFLYLLNKPYLIYLKNNKISKKKININIEKPYVNEDFFKIILLKFISSKFYSKVFFSLLNINKILSSTEFVLVSIWFREIFWLQKKIGEGANLKNIILITYISLKLKDLKLLYNLLRHYLKRVNFWKHKMYFKFFYKLINFSIKKYFNKINIKGFRFEIKGKISVAGNSRKRKTIYLVNKSERYNLNYKSKYINKTLNTITGVLGIKIFIYYN